MDDMTVPETTPPAVVSPTEWLAARRALLAQEKLLTQARDAVAAHRRAMPRVRIEKDYVFETEAGPRRLGDLFEGRPQLLIQHFMFAPDWEEGCTSCSLLADHIDGARPHLAARGVTLVAASRAPLARLLAFRERMGWRFPWVSAGDGDFNYDFSVAFPAADVAAGAVDYNYERTAFPIQDAHGISAFFRSAHGAVYHTYSTYARGVDLLVGAYNWLDLAPLGRDEDALPWTMDWVRHHDRYEAPPPRACCVHG
jgi:predicted dithiol-disulfide oxidoreductase (DUF899 family)